MFLPQASIVIKVTTGIGENAGRDLLGRAISSYEQLPTIDEAGVVVVFDLANVQLATTSFVKACILPLFQSGRAYTDSVSHDVSDAFGFKALNVFPVIANANRDAEDLVDEIFGRRKFPTLSLRSDNMANNGGRQIGFLENTLVTTMQMLDSEDFVSAAMLSEKYANQVKITQTAWSNRLNDLWRVRLLQRVRNGKTLYYKPLKKEIIYGR